MKKKAPRKVSIRKHRGQFVLMMIDTWRSGVLKRTVESKMYFAINEKGREHFTSEKKAAVMYETKTDAEAAAIKVREVWER